MKTLQGVLRDKAWFGKQIKFDDGHKYLSKGFTMVPNQFLRFDGITANDKMVFVCILSFAYTGNTCFPSLTELRAMSGLTKPTLIKIIKTLELRGFLRTEKEVGSNNNYIIDFTHLNNLNILNAGGV